MAQTAEQAEYKRELKAWLKMQGLDYSWIADQCGVTEVTVRNWMSQKTIPELKMQLIRKMQAQMPAPPSVFTPSATRSGVAVETSLVCSVRLTPEQYNCLSRKAAVQGTTVESLVKQAIDDLILAREADDLRQCKVILPSDN